MGDGGSIDGDKGHGMSGIEEWSQRSETTISEGELVDLVWRSRNKVWSATRIARQSVEIREMDQEPGFAAKSNASTTHLLSCLET